MTSDESSCGALRRRHRATGKRLPAERLSHLKIILTVPSADPEELRRSVGQSESTQVPFKILRVSSKCSTGRSDWASFASCGSRTSWFATQSSRSCRSLPEDLDSLSVLITGAAGTIGSELVHQVALHQIPLDEAETDLFYVELGRHTRTWSSLRS